MLPHLRHLAQHHTHAREITQLVPDELTAATACLVFEIRRVAETFYTATGHELLLSVRGMLAQVVEKGLSSHGIELNKIDAVLSDLDSALLILTGFRETQLCLKRSCLISNFTCVSLQCNMHSYAMAMAN